MADSRNRNGGQQEIFDKISILPLKFSEAVVTGLSEVIVFAHPALKDPDATLQQSRFFQRVQNGIEAAGADVITARAQNSLQFVAVHRCLAGLVQDEHLDHTLKKITLELL